jgi:hypothetical protein
MKLATSDRQRYKNDRMPYTDRFLEALGAWQRGWREDPTRRLAVTSELRAAIAASPDLPPDVLRVYDMCYRKRYLVPNNPQNEGDFVPLILGGSIDEGVASWTTEKRFAQDFKDPIRVGTISAVFAHKPKPEEVILNIKALWARADFKEAVAAFASRGGRNAVALQYFRSRQSEVILNYPLRIEEIEGFCARSSPFDVLCEAAEITDDSEKDNLWRQLVEKDVFPEQPMWTSKDSAIRALEITKNKFDERVRALKKVL